MKKQYRLVNTNLEKSDYDKLETMMDEDGFHENTRSAFMRRMIRQEYSRRHPEAAEAKTGVQEC